MSVPDCVPPTGAPLVGRTVRLDRMLPSDAAGLLLVYADPRCYTEGYRMSEPHRSVADTEAFVASSIAAASSGRTAYTVRLVADSALGAAGTVVGSTSLGDVDVVRQHVHLGRRCTARAGGARRSTRRRSSCCSPTPSTRVGSGA